MIALVLISIFLRKQSICWLTVLAAEEKPDRLLSETQDEAEEIAEVEAETWNTKVSENTSEVAIVDIPTAEAVIQEQRTNLPAEIRLEVPVLFQAPELPTGCESVALTMALNYHGFGLEKTTIANDYLIYDNGNFAEGYMGNPFSDEGAGIFPPGLANTANRFFQSQDSSMSGHNISGTELMDLYAYVAAGYPVLIWTTMYYDSPIFEEIHVESGGRTYQWYINEHCVVLGGYNLNNNTVTIFDSLQGEIVLDAGVVQSIYDSVGQYAVTIY